MLVECIHGDFSDPEAVSGSSTISFLKVENKKHPARDQVGMFFVLCELHIPEKFADIEKESATASKTDSSSVECGVILESIFVFGFCARILLKSYLYNNSPKRSCQ